MMALHVRRVRVSDAEPETQIVQVDVGERVRIHGEHEEYWRQQANMEKEERLGLTSHQHALVSLGYAAECRACVVEYMQEPRLPFLPERDQRAAVRAAVDALARNMHAQRHYRPAPKARARNSLGSDDSNRSPQPDAQVQQLQQGDAAARMEGAAAGNGAVSPDTLLLQGKRPRRPAPQARQRDDQDGSVPPSEEDLALIPSASPGVERNGGEERAQDASSSSSAAAHGTPPQASSRPRRPAPKARQRNLTCDGNDTSVPLAAQEPELIPACNHEVEPVDLEERMQGASSSSSSNLPAGVHSASNGPRPPAPQARQRDSPCEGHAAAAPPSTREQGLFLPSIPEVAGVDRKAQVQGASSSSSGAAPGTLPPENTRPPRPAPKA
eukprot:TRINITY_DN1488_c0_g1_i2.p1 TRINITY_DN1488_c0_g1~~TRINITY_DN1488_c0_g1_i2.p1  ORF type:complete len:383 (+),score=39.54 TRINITY_DN1488_c0_g1_i2:186-1334(+)